VSSVISYFCGHVIHDCRHTIRSAVGENLMLYANCIALCFTEPELLLIEVLHCGSRNFLPVFLWPWVSWWLNGHYEMQWQVKADGYKTTSCSVLLPTNAAATSQVCAVI